jgi:hypothetical protein
VGQSPRIGEAFLIESARFLCSGVRRRLHPNGQLVLSVGDDGVAHPSRQFRQLTLVVGAVPAVRRDAESARLLTIFRRSNRL